MLMAVIVTLLLASCGENGNNDLHTLYFKDIEKRKASGKKSFSERLTESMMGQAPEEETKETNKSMSKFGNMNLKNFESEVDTTDDADDIDDASDNNSSASAPKKGSLADKANAVKRFNDTGVK